MHRFDVHRIFYGHRSKLTNYQIRVYGSPRVKAIATTDNDVEKTQAAIVLALSQGFDPLSRAFQQVRFFVPETRKAWILHNIRTMAENLTKRIRAEQATSQEAREQGQKVLRILKEWIGQLSLSHTWTPVPPEYWAAFGYTNKDQIPSWVNAYLG